ncbi:serine O-acetyltransferase EpsC [Klebsiella michiganensis]|uniref:serine O-acetyltransferase EpsC n=1 Tax=Klebsiella TaxID=570 RepID=UPI0005B2F765|nr:serine acetyltransferase [Klebsiella sp. RCJ4]MBZ6639992.1 serine acetyltransferase [Klebsiella michiganensis]MBZ7143122.1 serine acetyltransferase [Klebsiella michiganensis]MBZ7348946.1 serine acetyltransferase [Klebsiella michiganensis]RJP15255.1 serine acetyltransferase [Klebsiella michiganensis]
MPKRENNWHLNNVVDELRRVRQAWRDEHAKNNYRNKRSLPSRESVNSVTDTLIKVLYPMRLGDIELRKEGEDYYVGHLLGTSLDRLTGEAVLELYYQSDEQDASHTLSQEAVRRVQQFANRLPVIRQRLDRDILAAYQGDPSARSMDEVLLCYPGIHAVMHYRLAHELHQLGLPLLARMISEKAHSQTGIDIHPDAQIDDGFFIDHGTGVVIGETAIVGKRVRIYQAVTLGAKRFIAGDDGQLQKNYPRHPIIEDDVVIYAGATILGRITIGARSSIGGNIWLTRDVPPDSHVQQARVQQKHFSDGDGI